VDFTKFYVSEISDVLDIHHVSMFFFFFYEHTPFFALVSPRSQLAIHKKDCLFLVLKKEGQPTSWSTHSTGKTRNQEAVENEKDVFRIAP
jgi:hypothetical protein